MKNITIEKQELYLNKANLLGIEIPENIKDLKIIGATLKVKAINLTEKAPNYQVFFLDDYDNSPNDENWLIDQLIAIENNQIISIDISDEFQHCLDNSLKILYLKFVGCSNIEFESNVSLNIDYIDNTEFEGNGNKNEIDLGKAGKSIINLVSGTMALSTPLISSDNKTLPFSIYANYNSSQNELIKDIGLPTGWSLNFNQFLIKNNHSSDEEEKVLSFTFIDNTGKSHIIEEKYYVADEQKSREELMVDLDGNLIYRDENNIEHKVTTKLESSTGLKLVSSIKGLNGSDLVDYEPDEIIQIKNQLKQLEKSKKQYATTISGLKQQLFAMCLSKYNSLNTSLESFITEINTNENTDKSTETQSDIDKLKELIRNKFYIKKIEDSIENGNGSTILASIVNREINSKIQVINSDEKDQINLDYINNLFSNEEYINYYNALVKTTDERNEIFSKYDGLTKLSINEPPVFADISFYKNDNDIIDCLKQIANYRKEGEEIDEQIDKYNHKFKELKLQCPVHYLYNDNNIIYGFGETNDENIFRLILITDPYENNLFISYQSLDSNKIESISDKDNNYATFNYSNELISSIQDTRDRIIKFNYIDIDDTSKNIKSVTFVDDTTSYYYYNNNQLTTIVNQSGFGAKFTYTDNKVTKVESISILNKVENGKIFYRTVKENTTSEESTNQETNLNNYEYDSNESFNFEIIDFNPYILKEKTLNITYNNYRSTTITNANNKSITYNFDKFGNTTTTYENKIIEKEDSNNTKVTEYSYSNNLLSEKITKYLNSHNYLDGVSFSPNNIINTDSIVIGETVCGDESVIYENENRKNIFKISNYLAKSKYESVNVPSDKIIDINTKNNICDHKIFIVSGWAKADSAFVITDEDEENYANYIKERKFQIKVDVMYEDETKVFSKSFDWRNTDWQYCAVPVLIENKDVKSITCSIDYRYNTGSISYTNLDFYEGDYEHIDYNDKKQPKLKYSGHSKWKTKFKYDENDNLIEEIISDKNNENEKDTYITTYEYNKNNKLLRSINHYDGLVKENVYNDKGRVIKTLTYHKDEPTNIFFEEHNLDENGNETYSTNEFGEKLETYEYLHNTNIVETTTDYNGNKTSYGYDKNDNLLQSSTTVNGIENANTYGYTLDFLTKLKHNDFDINYDYDGLGRLKNIDIAGNNYLTNEYILLENTDDNTQNIYNIAFREEITTLANGEIYKKVYNENDNLIKLFYKATDDITELNENDIILENTYDNIGNLIKSEEKKNNKQKTHIYTIDKFGNTTCEEIFIDNSENSTTDFKITNTYDTEHDKVDTTVINVGSESLSYKYNYSLAPDKTLQSILLPNKFEQVITYDKLNRIDKLNLVNDNSNFLTKKYEYLKNGNHTSNLVSALTFAKDTIINNDNENVINLSKEKLSYKYDKNGNITEIRKNNNLLSKYTYDSLNRIIREDNKELNFTKTYFYDAGGNITERKEYEFTLINNLDYSTIIKEYNYSYPISGWKDQLIKYNNEEFVYDELGNPKIYRGKNLTWSYGRQLDRFDNVEYKYDINGLRTSKYHNSIYTKYYLNGNKIIAQTDTNNKTLYFHYGVDGVTGFKLNGTEYLYKKNLQNDIIGIYDINGQEIVKYVYDAWGNHKTYVLNDTSYIDINEDISYTEDGLKNKQVAEINPFRYRSYYYDSETNLYYLNSRYYDPELGRFINADDISILDQGKDFINGINLYSYCNNNPVMNRDESGNAWWNRLLKIFAVVAVVIVAVAISVATAGVAATAIMAGVGATIGVTSYAVSTAISGEEFTIGGFLGAAFGGAIGGILGLISLNPFTIGFISGAFSSLATDLIDSAINDTELDIGSLLGNAIIDGIIGGTSALIMNGIKIKGFTAGRGSFDAVKNQLLTKFKRGLISSITLKSLSKIASVELFHSVLDFILPTIKNKITSLFN